MYSLAVVFVALSHVVFTLLHASLKHSMGVPIGAPAPVPTGNGHPKFITCTHVGMSAVGTLPIGAGTHILKGYTYGSLYIMNNMNDQSRCEIISAHPM